MKPEHWHVWRRVCRCIVRSRTEVRLISMNGGADIDHMRVNNVWPGQVESSGNISDQSSHSQIYCKITV